MKAILTKYLGPTERRGARIKAYDSDGNSVTIGYPHDLPRNETHLAAAKALVHKMQWAPVWLAQGGTAEGEVFVMLPAGACRPLGENNGLHFVEA